jgi:NADH:ubiquinone oxidoreductase subunit 5 (subunit L)/multisubunit Na+/H+ antiporter MnhA subunit
VPVLAGRCMISDGLLLWGVLALWHSTASVQVDLADLEEIWEGLLRLTVLVGFMGKSAQFPCAYIVSNYYTCMQD